MTPSSTESPQVTLGAEHRQPQPTLVHDLGGGRPQADHLVAGVALGEDVADHPSIVRERRPLNRRGAAADERGVAQICQVHPYEAAEGLCRSCGGPFCADCLVYPFGPAKPPYCVPCAVTAAGGVRKSARNPPGSWCPRRASGS